MGGRRTPLGQHLDFLLIDDHVKRRTERWQVVNQEGEILGLVAWYSQWRRYTFTPTSGSLVFDAACLVEITTCLAMETRKRQRAREQERAAVVPLSRLV